MHLVSHHSNFHIPQRDYVNRGLYADGMESSTWHETYQSWLSHDRLSSRLNEGL